MPLKIMYVYKDVIAFSIDRELFYIQRSPNCLKVYDHSIGQLQIPNVDMWLQLKTQQRYSYRSLCDMADSFADGLSHSYTDNDLRSVCKQSARATRDAIFKTDIVSEFASAYWIELLSDDKLQKIIYILRNNFNKFKSSYTDDELYNILCRLWQYCNLHAPSESAVFESIIRSKLSLPTRLPHYPDTSQADAEIDKLVLSVIVGKSVTKYKGIPTDIVNNVVMINDL